MLSMDTEWALRQIIPAARAAIEVLPAAAASARGTPAAAELAAAAGDSPPARRAREDLMALDRALRGVAARRAEHEWDDAEICEYARAALDAGKQLLWEAATAWVRAARTRVAAAAADMVGSALHPSS